MNIETLVDVVSTFFQSKLNKPANVIGIAQVDNGWWVDVETVEDSEYLRKRGQDDLLAIYQVEVNQAGQIYGFKRKSLRIRGKVEFIKDE